MSSLLIKNALLCDGSGASLYPGSLLAEDGLIKAVERGNRGDLRQAEEVMDAEGAVLAPGFIDIHGHSDLQLLRDPALKAKTGQGITTEVIGNCGAGIYPFKKNRKAHRMGIRDILGSWREEELWDWEDLSGYKERLKEKGAPIPVCLQSHGALRYSCLDEPNREATQEELTLMEKELEKSLDQGAAGMSTGLYYAPCCFAGREELLRLCRVLARNGALFTVHHRSEGSDAVESLHEILQIALEAKVKIQVSHLKVIGKNQQHRVPLMLDLIDRYRARGLDVAFDQYPYLYGSTSLFSLLPPSLLKLKRNVMQKVLADPSRKEGIIHEIEHPDNWDSIIPLCGWDQIFIATLSRSEFMGLSLEEGARQAGMDPYGFLFKILAGEPGTATMIDYTQSEKSLLGIMNHPLQMFGTDALFSGSRFHPRTFNTVFHLFDLYYRQKKTASLESLVMRWTSRPAERLGLKDRGRLAPGMKADLLLLRPEAMKDHSTIAEPDKAGEGIVQVFREGQPLK